MNHVDQSKVNSAYAVNDATGVVFIVHPDMFSPSQSPRSVGAPDNLQFFENFEEAKAHSEKIIAERSAAKSVESTDASVEKRRPRAPKVNAETASA